MPVYSHSKFATYETCPQQYKLRYVGCLKVPESTDSIEAFPWSRVHDKQLKKYGKTRVLHPLNPKYPDIELSDSYILTIYMSQLKIIFKHKSPCSILTDKFYYQYLRLSHTLPSPNTCKSTLR